MSDHVIFSYEFDGNGGGLALPEGNISSHVKSDKINWIHLDANSDGIRDWLTSQEISNIASFVVDALLADETRPRMAAVNDGVLLILRGVNLNANADPEDMISIRLWIDKHHIVSVQRRQLKAVLDIKDRLKIGKGPKDAGEFICMLSSRLFERMEPVLTDLDDNIVNIEEKVIDAPDVSLREGIVEIRKKAILFRRYMAPQRDAIDQLRMSDVDWLDDLHRRQLQESYNHVTRYVEDLDAARERAQIVKDELANILSDRLNKNMYILSVIAAIFLPLGFLTGLLGVNLGGIPGADNSDAFVIFSSLLAVIIAIQISIFRFVKWL